MPPPSGVAGFRRGGRRALPPSGAGLLSGGRGLGIKVKEGGASLAVELANPWNPPGAPEWETPVGQGPGQLAHPAVYGASSDVSSFLSNCPVLVGHCYLGALAP